jgi:hypothetical protein
MTETTTQINESDLKRFLYGEVSEAERQAIEDDLLLDDNLYYRLLLLENKLVDQYVAGKMTGEDLHRFEKSLEKVPPRRIKIANSVALQTLIEDERPPEIEEKVKDSPKPKSNRFAFFSALALGFAGLFLMILIPLVLVQFQSNDPISKITNTNTSQMPNLAYNSTAPTQTPRIDNKLPTSKVSATLKSVEEVGNLEIMTIQLENPNDELSLTLILPPSAPEESLYAKVNGESVAGSFVPVTQKDGRNVITLTVSALKLAKNKNKINLTDYAGNVVAVYNFNLRKR